MKIIRWIVLPPILLVASCTRQPETHIASSYVDSKLCAGCHASQWETFRRTGMGRSFYRATPATMADHFPDNASFYHKASDRSYQMLRRGDRFFQRRFQKDGAVETNVVEASIDYVMGSGNHARTYLYRTKQNRLLQLPVTWYPGTHGNPGVFAMSPGYDRADHFDFRRKIAYDCFFCHNAYPALPPGNDRTDADPVYPAQLPEGIDCQRCHGPGGAHVEAAQQKGATADIQRAIVNPARLTADRQLEICMQCHLETTSFALPASIQRYERGAFSFRPGEPIVDFMLHFDHAANKGHEDKFEIVSAAYRLRQSACFQKSGGALLCTTCHNPHRVPRGEEAIAQFTAACLKCHRQTLEIEIKSGRHPSQGNCIPCHMAQRRTEDVIHTAMTDHRILRRQPARDLLAPLVERHDVEGSYRGEVVLYYPPSLPVSADRDLYLAVAQVAQQSNLQAGIPQLEDALRDHPPHRPEFYMALAQAQLGAGQTDKAIASYRLALQVDPRFLPALRGLGAALAKGGDASGAAATLEQARSLDTHDAATLHELGLAYHALGRSSDAVAALQEAIRLDPDLPEIRNTLGNILLETGIPDQAEDALREAVRSQPDFAAAHTDLGNALAAKGDLAGAEHQYHLAIQLDPANSAAHYSYGAALASRGRFDEAQKEEREAVRLAPDFPEAQAVLGDLYSRRGEWRSAMACYREALRLKPDFGRAHLGLGTALAVARDASGAREHLTQAARDSNPAVRQEAQELLQQLPR